MKIVIPEDLSEITLEQYQRFRQVEGDDNFMLLKMVEIFCNVPLKDVAMIPLKELDEIVTMINEAFKKKRKFKNRFTLNGVEYGFIPSLEDITFGEYVDLESYIGKEEDLHKLLAILYRPITVKNRDLYDIEEYKADPNGGHSMRQVPLDIALEAPNFFFRLGSELLKSLADSLSREKLTIQEKQILEENGVGIRQFTQSLREIYLNSQRLLQEDFMSA